MTTEWKKRDWEDALLRAFEQKGELTLHDVVEACGIMFWNNTWYELKRRGWTVEWTGRKDTGRTHNPKLYRLVSKPAYMDERVAV